jgi:hypothetical protein
MSKLERAIGELKKWQKANYKHRAGRCLEAIRYVGIVLGYKLPPSLGKPNNTALFNFSVLVKHPADWGWVQVHNPDLPDTYLAYWGDCGKLKDGRTAGHVGIVHNGIIYSNSTIKISKFWNDRLKGAFILRED